MYIVYLPIDKMQQLSVVQYFYVIYDSRVYIIFVGLNIF